jgi:hypothetical protein
MRLGATHGHSGEAGASAGTRAAGTRSPAAAGPPCLQRASRTGENPRHNIYLPGLEQRGLALQLQLGRLVYSGQAGQVRTLGTIFTCWK